MNVIPSAKPVRQKVRRFHPDRHRVIKAEVDNLLKVGFIKEIKYPKWLANAGVVPKKGGKWRVSIDYKNLNKACPKRQLPSSTDRSDCRRVGQTWDVVFPGRLLRISSNIHTSAKCGKNSIYHPTQAVLLQCDVIWLKECRGNVSEVSDQDAHAATRKNHGGLH